MKKAIFYTFLFILFILNNIIYLSFGYETNSFNKIVKSQIKESNGLLNFEKISFIRYQNSSM